jgi:hypothetical protein
MLKLFPGSSSLHRESNNSIQLTNSVTFSRSRNIHLVPIDYGFRPRLRGRLTLRGSSLRRNPWTFSGHDSHMPYCYSCQHSHFRYLQKTSRFSFISLRNAPLPLVRNRTNPHLRCIILAPVHFRRRTTCLDQ